MRWLGILLGVGLMGWLATGLTQVRPGERGLVRRFGRVVDVTGPGLRVGFPWGIEDVERVAIDRVRSVSIGYRPDVDSDGLIPAGQLLTGDHNLVNVQAVVDYAVREDEIESYALQASQVDGLVERMAEAALAEWISGATVDEVLLRGKVRLPGYLVDAVQARLGPHRLGIQIQSASVAYLFPPDEVRSAFDDVARAQTAIRTREQEARQEAARRLREVEADKYRLEQLTAAHVKGQEQLARTDAAAFNLRLDQYRRLKEVNPDVLSAIWWDETGKLLLRMKQNGRVDILDNHLAGDGLDILQFGPQPRKR